MADPDREAVINMLVDLFHGWPLSRGQIRGVRVGRALWVYLLKLQDAEGSYLVRVLGREPATLLGVPLTEDPELRNWQVEFDW